MLSSCKRYMPAIASTFERFTTIAGSGGAHPNFSCSCCMPRQRTQYTHAKACGEGIKRVTCRC